MRKFIITLLGIIFLGVCNLSIAQSYEYSQGYIFDQKYVKRIPVSQAEKILSSPGLFSTLMQSDWRSEKIPDTSISRVGDSLIFKFTQKNPLSLRNYYIEPRNDIEGDSQIFIYLKKTATYHIVGVYFMHDQPHFLLISKTGINIYFVETN